MPKHKKHAGRGTKHVTKILGSDDEIRSTTDESVRSADSICLEEEKPTSVTGVSHPRLSSSSLEDFPSTRSHIRDTIHQSTHAVKPGLTERQQLNMLLKSTAEDSPRSPNPLSLPSHKKQLPRVQRRNAQGETHLHLACIKGELRTAMDLVAKGAQVDAPDNAGWTPLHEAANFGHAELVGFLLKCGAKANAQSIDRETPLHDAALSGHEEICKRLLSYDANPLNVNKDGKTAIDLTDNTNIKQILSNPKQYRNRAKKSEKTKPTPTVIFSDNDEGPSSVFNYPEIDSPAQKLPLSPDKPLPLSFEVQEPLPSGISESLESYTSKWARGDSSTDETRESELSPTIMSKFTKLSAEHPKMLHNRNSNNSEKKKRKRKKELFQAKVSGSNGKRHFSQEEELPSKSSDNELARLHSPGEEGTAHKRSVLQPGKNKSESLKLKKKEILHNSSYHREAPVVSASPHNSKPTTKLLSNSTNSIQKQKRVNKRAAEMPSDTSEENSPAMRVQKTDSESKPSSHTDQKEGVVSLIEDISWLSQLPPLKRIRPLNHSALVQRRCEKSTPAILPTNFDQFLSYRQDYASNRIDPSAPLSHSYTFPPPLMSLYEEQERARLVISKRHAREREQLTLTFEQELLRMYQRSTRATPPPSACAVLSSSSKLQQGFNSPAITPLDPPHQQYDPNLLRGLVQDLYDKFNKLIQSLTARQKSDCDALYFTQIDSWDRCVQSLSSVKSTDMDTSRSVSAPVVQ